MRNIKMVIVSIIKLLKLLQKWMYEKTIKTTNYYGRAKKTF